MSEHDAEQPQLPLVGIGPRLKAAREAAGISREQIAARTRIAERLIIEIEAGNWDALPSRTYVTGFARSYARSVGLNEVEIVAGVRREIGLADPVTDRPSVTALEPGDPARVPGSRFAWWLAFLALAIAVGGYFAWRALYAPALVLPPYLPEETASAEAVMTTEATAPAFDASLAPSESAIPSYSEPAVRRPAPRPERRSQPTATPQGAAESPAASPAPASPQPSPPPTPSTVSM